MVHLGGWHFHHKERTNYRKQQQRDQQERHHPLDCRSGRYPLPHRIYRRETRRDITANEKNAGQATLTGLKAATTYKVSIYNNQKLRGNCKFETTEDFPEGYNIANLKEGR